MTRKYIAHGDIVYCTGCNLKWDAVNSKWEVHGLDFHAEMIFTHNGVDYEVDDVTGDFPYILLTEDTDL